jgi:hypothetical protein
MKEAVTNPWDSIEYFIAAAGPTAPPLEWGTTRCALCNDAFPCPPLDFCIDFLFVGACLCSECLPIN